MSIVQCRQWAFCPWLLLVLSMACGPSEPQPQPKSKGAPDATAGDANGACNTHKECIERHAEHWICRADHKCVALKSTECELLRGDDTQQDAIFVGVLAAESNAAERFEMIDLVRRDFTQYAGGLPRAGEGKARPFVLIGCSFPVGGDPLPAARQLIETIGVHAMIGPWASPETLDVAQNLSIPAGVLLMTPSAQSDVLTDLADSDLVFRTNPTAKAIAPQIAAVLSDVEAEVRSVETLSDLKVALIYERDTYGLALSMATMERLHFNGGLNGEENEQRGHLLTVSYDSQEPRFEKEVARRVIEFAPHIVIALTSFDVRPLRALEEGWPAGVMPPYYVTDAGALSADHLAFVGSRPDSLRGRLHISANLDPSRLLYKRYLKRVEQELEASPGLLQAESTYDAAYAVAYAIVAATEGPLSGAAVAKGLRRLVGGEAKVEVFPSEIERAVAILRSGKSIDLDGASGAIDFDEHGDVVTDGSVWCFGRDAKSNAAVPVFSHQVFHVATGQLEGHFQCE